MQAEQSDEGGAVGLAEACMLKDNILKKVLDKLTQYDHFNTR
jgi:hypothetical protein